MKIRPYFICLLFQLFLLPICNAQDLITISNPQLGIMDNLIHIDYDLESNDESSTYSVRIEVTDENGHLIKALALSGDIGVNVIGGNKKHIEWDYQADSLFIDADIFITVYAIKNVAEEFNESNSQPELSEVHGLDQFNRTGIVLQSLAFPGLGLSRVNQKPHWLMGVAGYGCIAGSMVYYNMGTENRELSHSSDSPDWKTYYDDLSAWQYNISMAFAAGALVIWVSDFIWTIAGTSKLKKDISLSAGVEPLSSAPVVRLKYTF